MDFFLMDVQIFGDSDMNLSCFPLLTSYMQECSKLFQLKLSHAFLHLPRNIKTRLVVEWLDVNNMDKSYEIQTVGMIA